MSAHLEVHKLITNCEAQLHAVLANLFDGKTCNGSVNIAVADGEDVKLTISTEVVPKTQQMDLPLDDEADS